MKTRTKLVALLAGIAAVTTTANVSAFGAQPSHYVAISNRAAAKHNISVLEFDQSAHLVRNGMWAIGTKKAHYWVIGQNDWVEVQGPNGFDQKIPATSLPACFRITAEAVMHQVTTSCSTNGASQTWGPPPGG